MANSAVTLNNGGLLQLRNNNSTTFNTPGTVLSPTGTAGIDVNYLTSGGGTMTLNGTVSVTNSTGNTSNAQINVTGGNGCVLSIPALTLTDTGGGTNPHANLDINPTTANVILGTVTTASSAGGWDDYLYLDGTSAGNQVTGSLLRPPGAGISISSSKARARGP